MGVKWQETPRGEHQQHSTLASRWHPPAKGKEGFLHVLCLQSALQPSSQASQPPSMRNNYHQKHLQ